MDENTLSFANEVTSDWKRVKQFEKAENFHYGFFLLSVITLPFCWYFRSEFESVTAGDIPYNEYAYLSIPVLLLIISIIGWRAKRNTKLTQGDLSLHYFGQTILKYNGREYKDATRYLDEFETRATRNANDLFTDSTKENIGPYFERFEEDSKNKDLFDETFDEFATAIISEVNTESDLDKLVDKEEHEEVEKPSTAEVISEGLGGFSFDRYVLAQLILVLVALYVFYNVETQLGMFLVISGLPMIQYIKNAQE